MSGPAIHPPADGTHDGVAVGLPPVVWVGVFVAAPVVEVGAGEPQEAPVYVTLPVAGFPEPLQKNCVNSPGPCTPAVALLFPFGTDPYITSNLLCPSYSLTS
jgi:hypothetical protein